MFKGVLIAAGCLVMMLFHLNCTGTVNYMNGADQASSLKNAGLDESGNGHPYGGKIIPGLYIRPLTEKLCGPHFKNLGEIMVSSTRVRGTLVSTETCTQTAVDLSFADLEFAEYKQGRVGFLEGIYSLSKSEIDEVWCRREGSSSAVGLDVVIRADYKKSIFTAVAVSATVDSNGAIVSKAYEPQHVSRKFEDMERVRYRAEGFELEIRRRSFNSQTGMMEGDLEYETNGINTDVKINCRLGGELDVMIGKP